MAVPNTSPVVQMLRDWVAWIMATLLGLGALLTRERHFFNARVDERVRHLVDPASIRETLLRIERVQKDTLDQVIGLHVRVGRLEGMAERRKKPRLP